MGEQQGRILHHSFLAEDTATLFACVTCLMWHQGLCLFACRAEESLRRLLELTETCGKMVIFSGSGLSANSGWLWV